MIDRDALVRLDKAHVWHPYTAADEWERGDPLVVVRAEGSRLFDETGRAYYDANSSWWAVALGHGHPRLVRALREQSESLVHCSLAGIVHEPAVRLAEELVRVALPGLSRVFFSDDGSTAVEAAVKIAVQHFANAGRTKKKRIVALESAFHGETVGAASLGGVEVFKKPYAGVLFDCVRVPSPAETSRWEQAFSALETSVAGAADEIAAIVLEPLVQGAAGMQIYDAEYVRRVRELCDRHDVLFVADEVFVGYGRTGRMWACDRAGVSPDVLCVGKGFTAGMLPMAATLVTERVYDAFRGPKDRALFHGHTYCGNPLGAAVAREVLRVFEDERVLGGIPEREAKIRATFERLAELPRCRNPRALGMIGAIDLVGDEDPYLASMGMTGAIDLESGEGGYFARVGWRVYDEARRRGAYLRPLGDVVYVTPPLNVPLAELDDLLGIVDESVRAVVGSGG